MLRSVDLELLAIGMGVGIAVPVVFGLSRRPRFRGRVSALGVVVALAAVLALDERRTGALPSPLVVRDAWILAGVLVVALAGRGAGRLPDAPGRAPVLVPLVLAQLIGVWAGVPETSAALLATGVVAGVTLIAAVRGVVVTRGGRYGLVALPVAATLVGAVGGCYPALGGLLVSAMLALAAFGPRRSPTLTGRQWMVVMALQLGAAASAARLVGVQRSWGSAALGVAITLVLSGIGARVLAGGRQRPS